MPWVRMSPLHAVGAALSVPVAAECPRCAEMSPVLTQAHALHCLALATGQACCAARLTGCSAVQDAMQFAGRVAYHAFGGVADENEEMEHVAKVAKDADVLFLRNHGVIVVGPDVETAFSRLYYLERCCQTQLLVHVRPATCAPPLLPPVGRFPLPACLSAVAAHRLRRSAAGAIAAVRSPYAVLCCCSGEARG